MLSLRLTEAQYSAPGYGTAYACRTTITITSFDHPHRIKISRRSTHYSMQRFPFPTAPKYRKVSPSFPGCPLPSRKSIQKKGEKITPLPHQDAIGPVPPFDSSGSLPNNLWWVLLAVSSACLIPKYCILLPDKKENFQYKSLA